MNQFFNKDKKKVYLVHLFFCINFLFSQNLVINPSFEDTLDVYNPFLYYKEIGNCKSWFGDYVVYNNNGKHNNIKKVNYYYTSYTGKSHIAMSLELNLPYYLRVHATGVLKEVLKTGITYNYSYYIKPVGEDEFAYSTKNVQLLFSNTETVDPFNKPRNNLQGHISKVLDNGWYKISGTYKAKGNEKYIILNYFDNDHTNTFKTKKWRKKTPVAVCLIDEVSVSSIAHPIADRENLTFKIEPEIISKPPNTERFYFEHNSYSLGLNNKKTIANLFKYLNKNPNFKIKITAYTDNEGNDDYNKMLSLKRAEAIKDEFLLLKLENPIEVLGAGVHPENIKNHKKRMALIEIIED